MLRTAVVGYGGVARSHLQDIRFFRQDNPLRGEDDPVVELVAGCDTMPEALERFRQDTGVDRLYRDCEKMLDSEDLDFIHVATCAEAHVGPVVAAAQRGVHVLCEKPMAVDAAGCDEMIAACREAGVQLVISHQRRSDPLHWYARRLVEEGRIGELRYVTGTGKSRRGGNELHNIGSHLLDAVGIYGGEPQWVWAVCSTAGRPSTLEDREPGDRGAGWVLGDRVDLTVGYSSGVQASLRFSEDPSELHWVLWGTEGRMGMFSNVLWHCDDPVPRPRSEWAPVEVPEVPVVTASGYVNPPDWQRIRREMGAFPRVFMMREMFQRMETGGEHTSSGRVGAVPIEVSQAAFVSHLQGVRVTLPLRERKSPLA